MNQRSVRNHARLFQLRAALRIGRLVIDLPRKGGRLGGRRHIIGVERSSLGTARERPGKQTAIHTDHGGMHLALAEIAKQTHLEAVAHIRRQVARRAPGIELGRRGDVPTHRRGEGNAGGL